MTPVLFILASLFSLSFSTPAHDFYVSITQIEYNEKTLALEVAIKVTGHDLEYALEKQGTPRLFLGAGNEHEKADEYIEKYLNHTLAFVVNSEEKAFEYVGKEVGNDDDVWMYVEVPNVKSPQEIEVKNAILSDYFERQQNHVHLKIHGKTFTQVFMNGKVRSVIYDNKN